MFNALENIDHSLLLKINGCHSPIADDFFWLVSVGWIFFPLWIFLAIYIGKNKKIKFLVTAMLCISFTILFCDQSSNLIKNQVQRYRPSHNFELKDKIHSVNEYKGGKFGFFSAHSANTFGAATFIFLCLNWVNKKYRLSIFIWPIIVGYSRIYLGVHYPSDIIFGAIDGILFGIIFYKLFVFVNIKFNAAGA